MCRVVEPAVQQGSESNKVGRASGAGDNRRRIIGAVVGVFTSAIVVCCGLIYFHKQERRYFMFPLKILME